MVKDISVPPHLYIQWFFFELYFPVLTSFVLVLAIIIRRRIPPTPRLEILHEPNASHAHPGTRTSMTRKDESKYTIAPGILSTSRYPLYLQRCRKPCHVS